MAYTYRRKGPDGLQKLFLYLILLDWFILLYISTEIKHMTFRHGALASLMLAVFNLILVNLCLRRARRSGDSYLLYPVIAGALFSFILMVFFFFF
ncbi:hypothetical protein FM038_000270 [Shewanella eurypsychrophilus]|uniref:Uncharacterized protein n=1 Tax=Shewanella eurypsychrophilus TaxID=2593656 RepID=A0ABX6V695_9GAMM|nr:MULTISPECIES: hypothetical protein [Shewanella]QFU20458.1 hypothetical protein FS418_00270 [Shewanella sp. YLB-09]QFU20740.1 hypothetical protein FS418_01880 [Shewanella sp. YLB-09]QPG56035.1 hypothetical protein FM038_000270 [Shewanella eurypsychrophilus]